MSALRRWFQSEAASSSRRRVVLAVDQLEDRTVPASFGFRTFDGTGNNLARLDWGSAGTTFLRLAAAQYADGVSAVGGQNRPGARQISNVLAAQGEQEIVNDRVLSAMIYAWGQFIDHDLDLTRGGNSELMRIPVPAGDPFFDPAGTGTQTINTFRSAAAAGTGVSRANPRQQINDITAWLDGSMVYGSSAATAAGLRSFPGGEMRLGPNGLLPTDASGNFLAGDIRVNENPGLISLQTLFVREHNYWARRLAQANPSWTDEQLFQNARERVIGEIQAITYNEWLPALLGPGALPAYAGYNPNVNPGISNEFATAGFRMGHSLLGDEVQFLDNQGQPIRPGVGLRDAFFNPELVRQNNIDPILKYLASDPASELDTKLVDGVRNFLFGLPGQGGFDLAALNIQRGRDHGLADYNTVRAALGLPRVTSFAQITTNRELQTRLQQLYGNVNNIDLWVGGLAEDHVAGGSVGPTLRALIGEQFHRLRAADRFWYERVFTGQALSEVRGTTLADILRRNTSVNNVQPNLFVFNSEIRGMVFVDGNRNGRRDAGEPLVANRPVGLIDSATGEILSRTMTDSQGRYRFGVVQGLRTGQYRVAPLLNDGSAPPVRPGEMPIAITRGEQFVTVDLPVAPLLQPPPPPPGGPGGGGGMGGPVGMMGGSGQGPAAPPRPGLMTPLRGLPGLNSLSQEVLLALSHAGR